MLEAISSVTPQPTLSSGIYGDLHDFAAASGNESFAFGEGLPGRTWAEQKPLVLDSFNPETFKRTDVARVAGLTSGVLTEIVVWYF